MPLPKVVKGESKKKFMDRCLSSDIMNKEYPDNKQRYAVCNSIWDKSKKNINSGVLNMYKKNKDKIDFDIQSHEKLIRILREENIGFEDWEYLIHHIHKDKTTGAEEVHHCFMVDHLGNLYKIGHIKDINGDFKHCLIGLEEDQDVYWSDEEAEADGQTIPCANRQLE